jgi:hypothetical protein
LYVLALQHVSQHLLGQPLVATQYTRHDGPDYTPLSETVFDYSK